MNKCSEVQKLIQSFFDDDLDNRELSGFLDHVESCPECREELTIQLLVKVGMQRLEDGNTFNLNDEFFSLINEARKKLHFRQILVYTGYILEGLVVIAAAVCLLLIIAL